jgi:hypothetical protein
VTAITVDLWVVVVLVLVAGTGVDELPTQALKNMITKMTDAHKIRFITQPPMS